MSAEPIISVEGLSKEFTLKGGRNRVLSGIDLEIGEGSFTSLMGPSDCGKSMLLLCTAGLVELTHGVVRVGGQPIAGPPDEVICIFQQYSKSVFPWRPVRQNVAFGLEVAGDREDVAARCEDCATFSAASAPSGATRAATSPSPSTNSSSGDTIAPVDRTSRRNPTPEASTESRAVHVARGGAHA